jgi:hypothetical protein
MSKLYLKHCYGSCNPLQGALDVTDLTGLPEWKAPLIVESRYLLKSGHFPNQNTLYSRSSTQSNNSTSKATHSAPSCDRRRRVFSPSPEACAEWLSGGEEKGSPPSSAQSLLLAST